MIYPQRGTRNKKSMSKKKKTKNTASGHWRLAAQVPPPVMRVSKSVEFLPQYICSQGLIFTS